MTSPHITDAELAKVRERHDAIEQDELERPSTAVYICGGNETPGPRDECPNTLHDYPLPSGYVDASEVAHRRLRRGWSNTRCPDCNLYGWRPGLRDIDAPRSIDPTHQESV